MKTISLAILISVGLIVGVWLLIKQPNSSSNSSSQCQIQEMIFYYLDQCSWCQKVKNEGTIDKLEELGVKVNTINAAVGPVRHKFEGVPTFVINDKIYTGYKTFEELKDLLGCPKENFDEKKDQRPEQEQIKNQPSTQNAENIVQEINFLGDKGEKVILENEEVRLSNISVFDDNQARFYNVKMPTGKTIYFFVLKDKQGIYRAAANACVVCFKTYKGFRQEGNEIVCNNCGNRYLIEKIATEKGGCNPGPINPNLEVKNGQIIINQADLEQVSDLF